jgi:hypothetical protein
MKLFKYEGYEVKIAPEALTLKPFKKLWNRDKSKNKEKAINEFSFLYFYCDPRSDYQYIVDDESRMDAVKQGIGLPEDWKPDALMSAAITFYGTFDSNAARLLRQAAKEIDKAQAALDSMTPTDYKSIKDHFNAMKIIPEIASMIQEAEKALNKEEEYGEARGQIEKAMFDDGLDDVADWVSQQRDI